MLYLSSGVLLTFFGTLKLVLEIMQIKKILIHHYQPGINLSLKICKFIDNQFFIFIATSCK